MKKSSSKPKWGQQWDNDVLEYLSKKGPTALFNKMLQEKAKEPCLVLGFSYEDKLLSSFYKNIVGVNITVEEFHEKKIGSVKYDLIVCDAENLPFRDLSFKNVISRAFLHHVDPHVEIIEIKRILANHGFLFLWEPGKFNPVAALGRKFFPTNVHVKSEHPFNPSALKNILKKNFGIIQYEGYYHIISSALPILAKHSKFFKSRKIADFVDKIDKFLARGILKNFAWVLIFGVAKNDLQNK